MRDRVRDRVLRRVAAGAEDVAVPLVAGDASRRPPARRSGSSCAPRRPAACQRDGRRRRCRPRCRPCRRRRLPPAASCRRSGLPWSSLSITTILRPSTFIVPLVAYSRPIMKPGFGLLGVGLERAGLAVDQGDLDVLGALALPIRASAAVARISCRRTAVLPLQNGYCHSDLHRRTNIAIRCFGHGRLQRGAFGKCLRFAHEPGTARE